MAIFGGTPARSPTDDFYDRIHVIPHDVDLGNVVSQVEREVYIWNAYRDTAVMTGVGSTGADGVAFIDMPNTPYVFRPLKYIRVRLRATPSGGQFINAAWTLSFNTGDSMIFRVTGNRVQVFPFRPNWVDTLVESLEWRTDVMTSFDGSEQRRSITDVPRRTFEFSFLTKGSASAKLESLLWAWQNKKFIMPVWTNVAYLESDADEGDTIIYCDTRRLNLAVGRPLVLHHSTEKIEVLPVQTFTLTSVTLATPLASDWTARSRVMSGCSVYMPSSISTLRYSADVVTSRVRFWSDPTETSPDLPSQVAPVIYEGKEVVLRKFNWSNPVDNVFDRSFDMIDFGYGKLDIYTRAKYANISRTLSFLLKGSADMVWFRAFLARRMGRLKSFWIPSWHKDFEIEQPTPLSQPYLYVKGTDFAEKVGVDLARNRIMVKLGDGTRYYRRILNLQVNEGYTRLGLDNTFPVVISADNVESVQILLLCRLASDNIEIPWITGSIANPTVRVMSVNQ